MATTTHYVTVCLYTATQLPNAEDVHVVTTIAEQEWKSSSKQGPVPDWEQEEHVFELHQPPTTVTFAVVVTATGQVLATVTHPLQQATTWGSERCRLALASGSLNLRLEVATTPPGSNGDGQHQGVLAANDRGVSVTMSGKALETEEVIREYLDQHITAALKDALYEAVQHKPNNPLRFVAELLLKKAEG